MKTLFILGAGGMQAPAIRAARERGFHIVVADGSDKAVSIPLADDFRHIDLKDREGLLSAARALAAEGELAGVFTAGTDFSASAAFVAEGLGLPGVSLEAALNASDKARMRAVLRDAGVPCPRFAVVSGAGESVPAAERLGFPLVVKPVDNMGARGCRLVRGAVECPDAVDDALRHSRSGRAILEEYLEGPEFSIDALVYDGRIVVCGVADRHVVFEPYFVEMGHTMPTAHPADAVAEVLRVFKAAVRALGIADGVAKGDMKLTADGARVGEIAARLSGGFMSGWTYPYSSGVDLTAAALDLATGVPPTGLSPRWHATSAERAWISIPGRVRSVVGLLEAETIPYVKNVFPRTAPGDAVCFPSNNVEKCGNVISQAPTRSLAVEAAETAASRVLLRLEPCVHETDEFLMTFPESGGDRGRAWPPDAFPTLGPVFRRALGTMPPGNGQGAGTGVLVAPCAEAKRETARDWQGRSLMEAAEAARRISGFVWCPASDATLGAEFWRALVRGSYQAGAYLVDTVRETSSSGGGRR